MHNLGTPTDQLPVPPNYLFPCDFACPCVAHPGNGVAIRPPQSDAAFLPGLVRPRLHLNPKPDEVVSIHLRGAGQTVKAHVYKPATEKQRSSPVQINFCGSGFMLNSETTMNTAALSQTTPTTRSSMCNIASPQNIPSSSLSGYRRCCEMGSVAIRSLRHRLSLYRGLVPEPTLPSQCPRHPHLSPRINRTKSQTCSAPSCPFTAQLTWPWRPRRRPSQIHQTGSCGKSSQDSHISATNA